MRLPEDHVLWFIGVSGGADSMSLLRRALEHGMRLHVLTFNHAFADERGDEEEAFVREQCTELNVPLTIGHPKEPWTSKESKETFARRVRFDFFQSVAKDRLLLAHHADDRAENLILRLMRGCGLEGLTSFGWEAHIGTLRIVRPLIDETHAQQTAWLTQHGYRWIEDVSNTDRSIPRNALRAFLNQSLPTFLSGATVSLDLLTEENAFLSQLTNAAVEIESPLALRLRPHTDTVLIRRAVHQWLMNAFGHTATRRQMSQLLERGIRELSPSLRIDHVSEMLWERRI
ncbi:MAG: tRNA lysidine(34) synthetase TilS [Kiritimatiellia bacterium]